MNVSGHANMLCVAILCVVYRVLRYTRGILGSQWTTGCHRYGGTCLQSLQHSRHVTAQSALIPSSIVIMVYQPMGCLYPVMLAFYH